MPLVQAKCTNCGANLEVENTKDAAICPYCGSAYVVEKAINNYSTTNNISGSIVNIYGGTSSDFQIRGGVLEKYNGPETNVVIPDNVVEIGYSAFGGCKGIKSVIIPNSVKRIEADAFIGCEELSSIDIPDSVTFIGNRAFALCDNLEYVHISENATCIGERAFSAGKFRKVNIPDSIERLGKSAFSCHSIEIVDISEKTLRRLCPPLKRYNNKYDRWYWDAFGPSSTLEQYYSPWYRNLRQQKAQEAEQLNNEILMWIKNKKCSYCGGELTGLFKPKCKVCNRPKNY